MGLSARPARLIRIAMIALIVVLLWFFVREVDWAAVANALRHAALVPLLLSTAIYFLCLFGKALGWRIMLEPRHVVPIGRMFRYTIAAFAASALAPARAGEVLRIWVLKRREGVPAADSTAVAIAEKLLLALTLLAVCAPVPWLLPMLPDWVENTLLMCGGVAFGLLVALVFAVGHAEAREQRSWFGRFIAGMHVVRDPRRLGLAVVTLMLVWIADVIAVLLVLHAVGLDISMAGAMFILFSFNLVTALPSTPAQIGALQVGALAATRLLGLPDEPALAFALLYQMMQVVPLLVVGLIIEVDLVRGRVPAERVTGS